MRQLRKCSARLPLDRSYPGSQIVIIITLLVEYA